MPPSTQPNVLIGDVVVVNHKASADSETVFSPAIVTAVGEKNHLSVAVIHRGASSLYPIEDVPPLSDLKSLGWTTKESASGLSQPAPKQSSSAPQPPAQPAAAAATPPAATTSPTTTPAPKG